jgi:hypothetical protein
MKKLQIILAIVLIAALSSYAQPPAPNGGAIPGATNTPVGGAPIDGGTGIMIAMAVAWAMKKKISKI